MRQLQPPLPAEPSWVLRGKAGTRKQGLGLKPPNLARRGAGVRRRQRRACNSLLSGVLGLAQVGRGGPQRAGPGALSQPGSRQQLVDQFQGDAGSGVHGGLAQQWLMGNRCNSALCRSGAGGTGVGTLLPAPVALPPGSARPPPALLAPGSSPETAPGSIPKK